MNYEDLASIVNIFYSNNELITLQYHELAKKKENQKKAKELLNIRIDFKHVHMSGKEHLDVVLKKAYLYDFPVISKEKQHNKDLTELNSLICILESQITKLMIKNEFDPLIEKKRGEQKILQSRYDILVEVEPVDDNINFNGTAMKILKMLEKNDDESRKIHNIIKFKVCGTTVVDDIAIRKANLKYLTGEALNDEQQKIEKIESSVKSRNRNNMKLSRSTSHLSTGYILPHLRSKNNNSLSNDDITKVEFNMKNDDFPSIGMKEIKASITWGKKSFADLLKENTETENEEKKEELSNTIEVIVDNIVTNETQHMELTDIEEWNIES